MLELSLDGQIMVLPSNFSFKFSVDNSLFSEQGSYSHEISLPLAGCQQNTDFFGPAFRSETDVKKFKGDYSLKTDLFSSSGLFQLLEINEEDVKIQLLANKTKANFYSRDEQGDTLFLDELPLGDFLDDYDLNAEVGATGDLNDPPYKMRDYAQYFDQGGMWRIHAVPPRTNCVNFPITTTSDAEIQIANPHKWDPQRGYIMDTYVTDYNGNIRYRSNIAFQPQLQEIVKRLFHLLGFDFTDRVDMSHIFLANIRCTPHYASILPHWTINDFLHEVENFFDAVFIYGEKKAYLIKKSAAYQNVCQELVNVVSDFTEQYDEDGVDNFSNDGNVDYDWPVSDDMLRLPDSVWEQAEIKTFSNYTALNTFYSNMTKEDREKSQFLLIDEANTETYACLENSGTQEFELSKVDWFPPLLRQSDNRDIQTNLRIVPVRLQDKQCGSNVFNLPVMQVDVNSVMDELYSVNDAINPNASASNKDATNRDVIEVFYWDGDSYINGIHEHLKNLDSPLGVMVQQNESSGLLERIPFSRQDRDMNPLGPFLLHERFTNTPQTKKVDTKVLFHFKFIIKGPIDINQPFLIHGRKYVCKQLQYDCDADGVSPLVSGSFFALS